MQRVVVLGFDGALASAITGVVDLFAMAGVSWNRIQQQDVQRLSGMAMKPGWYWVAQVYLQHFRWSIPPYYLHCICRSS